MRGIIVRLLINVVGIWLATAIVPGIATATSGALIWAAICLGLVNAFIRPLIVVMTFPLTMLSLGLFLLIINAGMLNLAAWFVDGFEVQGFFSSVFGAIVVSLVSWAGSAFINERGGVEVLVVEKRRR